MMAILATLAPIAGIIAFLTYDQLIRLLKSSESALLNIEALLKVRHDLIPDLLDAMRNRADN
jgi:hypothetical protein